VRALRIKGLKDKTFGRHVKSKRFKSKENTFFFKFFRKKHATKKSGNLNRHSQHFNITLLFSGCGFFRTAAKVLLDRK